MKSPLWASTSSWSGMKQHEFDLVSAALCTTELLVIEDLASWAQKRTNFLARFAGPNQTSGDWALTWPALLTIGLNGVRHRRPPICGLLCERVEA